MFLGILLSVYLIGAMAGIIYFEITYEFCRTKDKNIWKLTKDYVQYCFFGYMTAVFWPFIVMAALFFYLKRRLF